MNSTLFRALTHKPFLFLFLAEIFSQIAMNMVNFVLIIVVFNLTNSSTAVSGVVLSYTLPAVFLGLLAGAIVDRWDKKKILIITNILRAFLLLDLAFFHSHLLPIYAFSLGVFIVTQFFIPAETPMIQALV